MEAYQEVGKAIEEVGHSYRVMHTVVDGEQWHVQPIARHTPQGRRTGGP